MKSYSNLKKIRVLYTVEQDESNQLDLCVTPTALVGLSSIPNSGCIKPIDFISPEEIIEIKCWVFDVVKSLNVKWRGTENPIPDFIEMIGGDLSIFLEYIRVSDLVLNKVINIYGCSNFSIGFYQHSSNMVQYEGANFGYLDLLSDVEWADGRNIKVDRDLKIDNQKDVAHYSKSFNRSIWKIFASSILRCWGVLWRTQINPIHLLLIKLKMLDPPRPSCIVAAHKDSRYILSFTKSMALEDFLFMIPKASNMQIKDFQSKLINSIDCLCEFKEPDFKNLNPYSKIIRNKLIGFIRKRTDLIDTYLRLKNIGDNVPNKMIVESTLGCGKDSWCASLILQRGGQVASIQHGGAYGNASLPMAIFTDYRYSYFFSYGDPFISPMNGEIDKYGKARRVIVGSPILNKIKENCSTYPAKIKKILYIMNLCVPFYSANFPWEHILEQLKTLEILQSNSKGYSIDVKKDSSSAVNENLFMDLNFINKSPREVLHEYDLIILESAISTAVLEAVVTKGHIVLFTGSEWEDVSKSSLDMLSKRAESFDAWHEFHAGLEKILKNPQDNLNSKKLKSTDFIDAYCNPVTPGKFVSAIQSILNI